MPTLNELKQDMDFMVDFKNIIEVFKSTALMQFRAFQETKVLDMQYYEELRTLISVFNSSSEYKKYSKEQTDLKTLIVVVTSDAGFVGDLNNILINNALDFANNNNVELFVLGSRGKNYLSDFGKQSTEFPGISDQLRFNESDALVNAVVEGYGERFDKISVFYPKFVSLAVQKVTEKKILPFDSEYSDKESVRDIEIEAKIEDFSKEVICQYLKYSFYQIFYSAKLSEYAARIMHLESSSIELNNLNEIIKHKYFKEVHARNDKSIREISASKLMMGTK